MLYLVPLQRNMCCNVETPSGVDAYSRKAKVTYNDCAKEVGPGIPKIVECIARKYKMVRKNSWQLYINDVFPLKKTLNSFTMSQVDEADNLSETGIKAVFSDFPLNEYQKTVKDISITVCVEKTKTISAAELIKILRQFYFCILQALMNACPDDDQNNSERCQDFRNGKFQWSEKCIRSCS